MKKAVLIGFLVLIVTGCGQLNGLQTARTLDHLESEVGGYIEGYGVGDTLVGSSDIVGLVPNGYIWWRMGLFNRMDVRLKASTALNLLADVKFQLVGGKTNPFAAAIGFGFEGQAIPQSKATDTRVNRIHFPLYLSYHFQNDAALYLSPKYVSQIVIENNGKEQATFLGSNIGFRYSISESLGVYSEASYFGVNQSNQTSSQFIYQFGVGLGYRF